MLDNEELKLIDDIDFPNLKSEISIHPPTDTTKIWVKLTHNGMSILDKFYRNLIGGSTNGTSPFIINFYHRCYKGYYEFYKMEYDQIFGDYHDNFEEKYTEEELSKKLGIKQKEIEEVKLLEIGF